MTLPELKDLASLPKIRFPAGNRITYGEDFSYYRGIPHDVDWYISKVDNGMVSLVREGYGLKQSYGNGCLLVKADSIPGVVGSPPAGDK